MGESLVKRPVPFFVATCPFLLRLVQFFVATVPFFVATVPFLLRRLEFCCLLVTAWQTEREREREREHHVRQEQKVRRGEKPC